MFNDEHQLWLQEMAKGPINIVQPFDGYKVHGIRFHIKARSANNKTYSHSIVVKGTIEGILVGLIIIEC